MSQQALETSRSCMQQPSRDKVTWPDDMPAKQSVTVQKPRRAGTEMALETGE